VILTGSTVIKITGLIFQQFASLLYTNLLVFCLQSWMVGGTGDWYMPQSQTLLNSCDELNLRINITFFQLSFVICCLNILTQRTYSDYLPFSWTRCFKVTVYLEYRTFSIFIFLPKNKLFWSFKLKRKMKKSICQECKFVRFQSNVKSC